MTRKEKKYLFDILQCIEDIEKVHLDGINTEEEFCNDLKTILSVERELAIIGEAAYQLLKLQFYFPGQDQAINRRNTLVHQYDSARPANLWNYVTYKISELKQAVSGFLDD
ncbi:MAG: HepT-like ribonuclease domain-containing protein [Bacteroidia bacterium]|nr:HepT-like ribonuclease domain-containing protein [Bacteroidia bacterium]